MLRAGRLQEIGFASAYVEKCLKLLDDHLFKHTYLVGEQITQADIACAAALLLAYQMVKICKS